MNKDTVAGAVKENVAKVKGAVDHAAGDYSGESKAKADQAAGNVQKNYGKVKDAMKDAVDEA